jgi:hypothetical protein
MVCQLSNYVDTAAAVPAFGIACAERRCQALSQLSLGSTAVACTCGTAGRAAGQGSVRSAQLQQLAAAEAAAERDTLLGTAS